MLIYLVPQHSLSAAENSLELYLLCVVNLLVAFLVWSYFVWLLFRILKSWGSFFLICKFCCCGVMFMNCKWDFFLHFNFFLQWWKIFWLLQQIQYKINIYIKICTDLTVLRLIGFLKRYFIKTMDFFFRSNYLLSSLCIKTSWIGH